MTPALGRCLVCGIAVDPFATRCADHYNMLAMAQADDEPEDDFKGASGWFVVYGGRRGRSVYADIDPGFGALRWFVDESGLDNPEDAGLAPPDDGFWRAKASASVDTSWEGDRDMSFTIIEGDEHDGGWEEVLPDGEGWKPAP